MFKIVDGQPIEVPDDARITQPMIDARASINTFLKWASGNSPEVQALRKQYREGLMSQVDSDPMKWYMDPSKPE